MRPLIPKVRIGEVLYGTKNLRHYLRTASIITQADPDRPDQKEPGPLYTPGKKDRFVVAANTTFSFCVWSPNANVVLLFSNSPNTGGYPPSLPKMNPEIFAQWFVRTNLRQPDLRTWPAYACTIWAAEQMNAKSGSKVALGFPAPGGFEAPFRIHSMVNNDQARAFSAARSAIRCGLTRARARTRHRLLPDNMAYGPSLLDLDRMYAQLAIAMQNPRLAMRLKGLAEKDLAAGGVLEIVAKFTKDLVAKIRR